MHNSAINKRQQKLYFIEQTYHMRMLGAALLALAVGACLYALQAPIWQWLLLGVFLLLWPQAAYFVARRAQSPTQTEFRNILLDALLAGFWIALVQFNAVPALTLLTVSAVTLVSAGGWRLLVQGLLALVLGCGCGVLVAGMAWHPPTSMTVLAFSIPLLVIYPVVISSLVYRLARRVNKQNHMLDQLSRTDELTQLPNRHHWQQALNLEFQRCLRTHRPATLVMLDLDGFKQLNDRCGHTSGDAVLRRVADILDENSRELDTPGRYGGDELTLVMPETDRDSARMVMERMRDRIEHETFDEIEDIRVTISIGLAEIDAGMSDPLDWIKAADDALYLAKEQGRNRVCTATYVAHIANNGDRLTS